MGADAIIEDDRWDASVGDLSVRVTTAVLRSMQLDPKAYKICVLFCSDIRIATLNADFRGKSGPTNVLSWPSEERATPDHAPEKPNPGELGDIAIAFETCAREAAEQGKAFDAHITHLLVHGVLHLLGFDHETDADAALMEAREVEILETLGLPDPY